MTTCTCPSDYGVLHHVRCTLKGLRSMQPQADANSAMFCEHANELPTMCPCDADCYCRTRGTCTALPRRMHERMTHEERQMRDVLEQTTAKAACADTASASVATPKAFEAVANGILRVKVEERPGMPQFGVFLGLYLDEHGDMLAVIRLDHYGLYLKALHPSKVTPVTPEEEETYKP
jgi:hypothetical protein